MLKPHRKHRLNRNVRLGASVTPKAAGGLRIGIGNCGSIASRLRGHGEIDGESGFANTAFLTDNGESFHSLQKAGSIAGQLTGSDPSVNTNIQIDFYDCITV